MSQFPTGGRGRGMFLRCLDQQTTTPAASDESPPVNTKTSNPSPLVDSGTGTGSPVTLGRSVGRGNRMFDQISISSKSSSQVSVSTNFQKANKLFFFFTNFCLQPVLSHTPGAPVGRGRSSLLSFLKTQPAIEDAQAAGDGVFVRSVIAENVAPDQVKEQDEKEESEAEVVTKRGTKGYYFSFLDTNKVTTCSLLLQRLQDEV